MANIRSLDLEASSSQYASISDGSQTGLDITGDLTLECWFKPETLGIDHSLISKFQASNYSYYFSINTSNVLRLQVSDDGSAVDTYSITPSLTVGVWYHLAVSLDVSTSTAKFYVNGLQTGGDQSGTMTSIYNGGADFAIGSYLTGSRYADGLIDEVRIWNDIRTAPEIADNKDKEISGASANLQGYWRLNNDYIDETSNDNDLTASGSPVFSTDVPFSDPSFIISESLSLSETSTNLRGLVSTTSESLSVSETISALKGISFTIAESLGLIESYAFLRTRLFIIADSLGLIEVKAYVQKKWSNVAKSTVATITNGVKTAVSVITNTPKS